MAQARIRPMTPEDAEPAAQAMLLHEFGDRRPQLRILGVATRAAERSSQRRMA